jgi:phasin family protein
MIATANPFAEISRAAIESASRATRIGVDSAERAVALQLEFTRGAFTRATQGAKAASQVKDVQELLALRTRMAEAAVESFMGYSRSLYEVASDAQSEYARLAEERMARFQKAVTETVDQAAKASPGGSDVAVAAIKSQLAATTAAFDSFTKAARHVASLADAGVKSAAAGKKK